MKLFRDIITVLTQSLLTLFLFTRFDFTFRIRFNERRWTQHFFPDHGRPQYVNKTSTKLMTHKTSTKLTGNKKILYLIVKLDFRNCINLFRAFLKWSGDGVACPCDPPVEINCWEWQHLSFHHVVVASGPPHDPLISSHVACSIGKSARNGNVP